jgi:hypothetical protein
MFKSFQQAGQHGFGTKLGLGFEFEDVFELKPP